MICQNLFSILAHFPTTFPRHPALGLRRILSSFPCLFPLFSDTVPLFTKKFFVSNFSQNLYKNTPRCPHKRAYIAESVSLAEIDRIRCNFGDISIGSQDISKTVLIFLTVHLQKNYNFFDLL